MGYARIQQEPFSSDAVLKELRHERSGGVTLYVGTVRRQDGAQRVDALHYEAYPEMAERELERLRAETVERFSLVDAIVIHRVGRIPAGEAVLLVAFSGEHRKETYAAVDHFMDRLKAVIPIWKQEHASRGTTWILGAEKERVHP